MVCELPAWPNASATARWCSAAMPTAGAQRLIEYVEAMDLTAQNFNRMASSEASMDHGTVRLTCGELLGVEVLPDLLRLSMPG